LQTDLRADASGRSHRDPRHRRRSGRVGVIRNGKGAVMTDQEAPKSRDEAYWAKRVSDTGLHVGEVPAEAVNLNVEGRRVAAMAGGFGKMYQVTYQVRLEGTDATPQDVVKVWKGNFASFWPKKNKFFGSTLPIAPADGALPNIKTG